MIQVENLVKHYGSFVALKGISFEVPSGQVLGFLGPNGAGKSTTMKILTGYLYPSSGHVKVDGIDVQEDPLSVRKKVGYLPETNPLYMDMRVDDYLRFVGSIRGLRGKALSQGIQRVVEVCGLARVYRKEIRELSKGYRQRVGLAQAMIHDPEILVLDEPTSGLDPNQIVEIRELIRNLGTDRTVLLSTHYLQEVEATCDRILIIAQGKIVADGTARSLTSTLPPGPLTVEIKGPKDKVETQLKELFPPETGVQVQFLGEDPPGEVCFRVGTSPESDEHVREAIFDLVSRNGWKLLEMHRPPATLEQVFRKLTLDPIEEPLVAKELSMGGSHV
ncbi:MAG TPA: ATP-binding cassette domain-containing protein [Planctomycetes bacterium]|nr:ATP-binding cassette domain-containing protein [Planctomycetota bacterium]